MPPKYKKKNYKKKNNGKAKTEMIRLSEGTDDCQAVTPIFHPSGPITLTTDLINLPNDVYYRQTSTKSTIGNTGPQLSSRIDGNNIYSKYLNYRYRLQFNKSGAITSDTGNVLRYRTIAGVFHDAPGHQAAPYQGWISDQPGTPASPDICDSDFEAVGWAAAMRRELKSFYTGDQIWGGLLEKARWTVIYDKVHKSVPKTGTAVQSFVGFTPEWDEGTAGDAPGLEATGIHQLHTREDIEGFIDFSRSSCCNKKLNYGPNVLSSKDMTDPINQAVVFNPNTVSDRGLCSTSNRSFPFVLHLNMSEAGDAPGAQPDPDLSFRWVHYFEDA